MLVFISFFFLLVSSSGVSTRVFSGATAFPSTSDVGLTQDGIISTNSSGSLSVATRRPLNDAGKPSTTVIILAVVLPLLAIIAMIFGYEHFKRRQQGNETEDWMTEDEDEFFPDGQGGSLSDDYYDGRMQSDSSFEMQREGNYPGRYQIMYQV